MNRPPVWWCRRIVGRGNCCWFHLNAWVLGILMVLAALALWVV